MNMPNLIFKTTDILRPILVKVVPMNVLREMKRKILMKNAEKLENISLEAFDKNRFPVGMNLIGNIKGDSGLGQSCRLVANMLEHSEYPVCIMEHSISPLLSTTDTTYDDKLRKDNPYGVNILHFNPHEIGRAYLQLGKKIWDYHYNIAYWLWELEEFPDEWVSYINLLDEIWTPSEYISKSIRKKTSKPVITIPYHVTAPVKEEFNRDYFKLPKDKFLFLMMFDCGSMIERKNPQAVISAFQEAFELDNENVGLIIKVNGGTPERIAQINQFINGYKNIYLINEVFSKIEINSLIHCVDAAVSLHRAEGFGLVMAEAMLNGVPCIATNWSANTEFMNSEVACMVDYKIVELQHDIGPYKKGNHWAEPDVKQASEYMKKLYEDREYRKRLIDKASIYINEKLGIERAASLIDERMRVIYG